MLAQLFSDETALDNSAANEHQRYLDEFHALIDSIWDGLNPSRKRRRVLHPFSMRSQRHVGVTVEQCSYGDSGLDARQRRADTCVHSATERQVGGCIRTTEAKCAVPAYEDRRGEPSNEP